MMKKMMFAAVAAVLCLTSSARADEHYVCSYKNTYGIQVPDRGRLIPVINVHVINDYTIALQVPGYQWFTYKGGPTNGLPHSRGGHNLAFKGGVFVWQPGFPPTLNTGNDESIDAYPCKPVVDASTPRPLAVDHLAPHVCDAPPYAADKTAYQALVSSKLLTSPDETMKSICVAKYVDGPGRQTLLTKFKFTPEEIRDGDVADLTVAVTVRLWNVLHGLDVLDAGNAEQDPFRKTKKEE
jgi:hypothetical protein